MPSDHPGEGTDRRLPFASIPKSQRDCLVAARGRATAPRPIAEKHLQLISPNSPPVIGNRAA